MKPAEFRRRLLTWYDAHGRKDLPWQRHRDPYRIWVAEIMLQQTQVTAVIPYYQRFMRRFPDIAELAAAKLDEVLHLWTGLGYYARARNLHQAAKGIVDQHGGRFPTAFDAVHALPGIGRSTAGAILAFAFGNRYPILDGNVKRVLTRFHAIAGWPGKREIEKKLWQLAEQYTPGKRIADYTQAIMDLGAVICRRGKPACKNCPLQRGCLACQQGNPETYPAAAPRKTLPVKRVAMLMVRNERGHVLLARRPVTGLWGGLWGFPEYAREAPNKKVLRDWCHDTYGLRITIEDEWPGFTHTFSHFRLRITPVSAKLVGTSGRIMENAETVWYNPGQPDARGFAAPVHRLLLKLRNES